MIWP